jgi:GntR family transcriptional regulator
VYSRTAEAIRNGLLKPGSMLPTETELDADMKVSRTVVREARMLLEEDGLEARRRAIRLGHTAPHRYRTHPPLRGDPRQPGQQLEVNRIQLVRYPASGFAATGDRGGPGTDCWLWESVLIRDSEAIAHLQENVSTQPFSLGSSRTPGPRARPWRHLACLTEEAVGPAAQPRARARSASAR